MKVHINVLDIVFIVKSLEQAQTEESSDSSEDEGDDEEEEPEPEKKEPEKSVNNNVFKFPPDAPKGMSNGHPRSRNATLRKTKQKGYWQNFLSGLLEK